MEEDDVVMRLRMTYCTVQLHTPLCWTSEWRHLVIQFGKYLAEQMQEVLSTQT